MSGIIDTVGSKSGIVGSDVYPAGHIIQVMSVGFSGIQTISNTTTFDTNIGAGVSGQEFSLPMAIGTGNKIVSFGSLNISANFRYAAIKVFAYDGSSTIQIAMGDAASSRVQITAQCQSNHDDTGEEYILANTSFGFTYSPGSTSSITYTVRAANTYDTHDLWINRNENDTASNFNNRGYSNWTLMEIKV